MTPAEIVSYSARYGPRFSGWLGFVLQWECVLKRGQVVTENVPGDGGGLTFAGIDQRSHPRFAFRAPTPKAVADEYFAGYWTPSCAQRLAWPVGEVVANFAVNMGLRRAVELLQTAVNLLPENGATVVDGIIGEQTILAAAKEDARQLADLIEDRADLRYRGIVAANASQRKFLQGWLNRDDALESWWQTLPRPTALAA